MWAVIALAICLGLIYALMLTTPLINGDAVNYANL